MAIHAHSIPVPASQRGLLRAFAHPLADLESTTAQPCIANGLAPEEALASTAAQGLLPDAEARALYSRRRLGEALEFGFALLDALESPDEDLEDDDPAEGTSLETFGRGFVRCGADDAEDESSDEDDELGDEHAPERVAWMFGPKRSAEAERQHCAAWLAAAEIAHACS